MTQELAYKQIVSNNKPVINVRLGQIWKIIYFDNSFSEIRIVKITTDRIKTVYYGYLANATYCFNLEQYFLDETFVGRHRIKEIQLLQDTWLCWTCENHYFGNPKCFEQNCWECEL